MAAASTKPLATSLARFKKDNKISPTSFN